MSDISFITAFAAAACGLMLNAANDLPKTNPWCYNQTAAGYLETHSRSLRFNHVGFKGEKTAMVSEIFPAYFTCGSWNIHSVPLQNDGQDHVPAGFNKFKSIKLKNPVMEFSLENEHFEFNRRYSLLPGSNIFKFELEWKSRQKNYINTLSLFYKPSNSYELKSMDNGTAVYTDQTGRKGFAVFADQSHYAKQKYGAVVAKNKIGLPAFNAVCIPKDEVIRLTAYLVLFKDADPEEAVRQAKERVFGKGQDLSVFPWKCVEIITTASLLKKDSKAAVWRMSPELAAASGSVPSGSPQDWQLSAAGNEFIADQLVITPKQELTGFQLSIADFEGPENAMIPAKLFRFEAVEAVPRTYPGGWNGVYGPYMDRLLKNLPENLASGKNQVFLFSGRIPAGQKPGEYRSELNIRSKEITAKIPVKLKIRSFSLPAEAAFYGDFLIAGKGWANKFSKNPKEDAAFCRQDLKSLRIHPSRSITIFMTRDGKLNGDPGGKFLKDMQQKPDGMQRFRVNGVYHCGLFSRRFKPCSPEMDDAMTKLALATCKALDKYDLTRRTLWQLGDECHERKLLKAQIHYSILTGKVAPGLRRFATINGYNPLVAELIRHTDIIVPHSDIFFSRIKPNIDLKGKEIWTYDNGFMSKGTRQTVVRGIAWRSARFGFTGYHQWCVNAWPKNWTTGFDNSGCVYYAPMEKETVPQRSLRLVNFALGISDFDYVKILRDEISRAKDRNAAEAAEKELNGILLKLIPDWRDQPADYRKLDEAKARIGDLIEKLKADTGK